MNTQIQFDWTKSRAQARTWQPHRPPTNIFEGKSRWQRGALDETPILRLSVLPDATAHSCPSFTVIHEPVWDDADGQPPLNFHWQQSMAGRFDLYFSLGARLKCLGLGERFSGLDVRGEKHTLLTTDHSSHNESTDALYQAIPFLIVGVGAKWYAIFVDSPAPCRFDLDSEMTSEGHIELLTRRPFNVYLLGPQTLPNIIKAFTSLVGRSSLPPLWALGHQQCRWSYADEETVRQLAENFRKRKIPCDTIVLDIDYMDEYRVFTTSPTRFPSFAGMVADLKKQNFEVVTIVDPGVKEDPDYKPFIEGQNKSLFCLTPEGELFIEKVWPGQSAFPDFLQPATRKWWGEQLKFYTDQGVAGIWNDMNEPAFFGNKDPLPADAQEMPPPDEQICTHKAHGETVAHLEVRNLYGLLMCQATHEGLLNARPNERPFILTRSGTAGIQRYAAVWLGDNTSWYQHLGKSIPMLLNMGLSGVPFVGVDIGGFWKDALPELLIRWYEVGIFYPFFRNHCGIGFRGQEPFAYAPGVEDKIRKLIETRYRLLPYLRNLFWEHTRSGAPLMRPLMWHYPTDAIAADIDDEFMLGQDVLVAPIVERAKEHRLVYLPEGAWYQFETNERFEGGRAHTIKLPLGSIPAFVREGAILPLAETMQHTGEYASKRIIFTVFGEQASCRHFEDDGISLDFKQGKFAEYQIEFRNKTLGANAVTAAFHSGQPHAYQVAGDRTVLPFALK